MLNTLLESKPRKQRMTGGTLASVVFHSTLVLFAVYATARAGVPDVNEKREQKVNFVKTAEPPPPEVKKDEPAPPKPPEPPKAKPKPKPKPPSDHRPAPLPPAPKAEIAPPKGFQVLKAPLNIPTAIPAIDLRAKATNADDFTGKGIAGGTADGVAGSSGTKKGAAGGTAIDTDRSYAEFEVERQVSAISGTSIAYPEGARSSGVQGEVQAQFVVNENGRVETNTFKVLSSSSPQFTDAVRNALGRMRFRPAQIGKTNVSQVVQQAFVFKLDR